MRSLAAASVPAGTAAAALLAQHVMAEVAGVVDGFNGNMLELGCFSLRYPTTVRSMTNHIDPHGIAPDVFIELDYISDPELWHLIKQFYKVR